MYSHFWLRFLSCKEEAMTKYEHSIAAQSFSIIVVHGIRALKRVECRNCGFHDITSFEKLLIFSPSHHASPPAAFDRMPDI
jgi:hypothetical protein